MIIYEWDVPKSVNEVVSDNTKQYQEYEPSKDHSKDPANILHSERIYESDDGW